MLIKTKRLNAKDFKKYGSVLTEYSGAPMADDDVITYWGKAAEVDICRPISSGVLFGHRRPMSTDKLERHLQTPEILTALEGGAVLIVASGETAADIAAFYIRQGEAVALNPGIWHWTPFPAEGEKCRFLVLFYSGTEENDLIIKNLNELIEIESSFFSV
jgi:ureidoglycolate hydrolase